MTATELWNREKNNTAGYQARLEFVLSKIKIFRSKVFELENENQTLQALVRQKNDQIKVLEEKNQKLFDANLHLRNQSARLWKEYVDLQKEMRLPEPAAQPNASVNSAPSMMRQAF